MVRWSESMQQTFEFYLVDPKTWGDTKRLMGVKTCKIDRDMESDTLGSASIECDDEIGEGYVRVYLVVNQNGIQTKHPLGTYLVQTPSTSFDGKSAGYTLDAYTPLLELKEKKPPIGYTITKGENILASAYRICRENVRAPISKGESGDVLEEDFVAELDEDYLSFLTNLSAMAKHRFELDERGGIIFAKKQDTNSLQPVWTFDDGNSSILYPDISLERDLYGVPNVVEVVYSTDSHYLYSRVENRDSNSPISIVNRGREVLYRETSPSFSGEPNQQNLDEYAKQLLRNMSCLEYTLQYTHGYCPVTVGDCIRLDYKRSGIVNTKALVIKQSISCEPGCPVTETAVFTKKLWG